MSGALSNTSGASSGSSIDRSSNYRVNGVPQKCWCGKLVVVVMSKSNNNPYRRYFHCGYARTKKLRNDKHVFKWVDEAILNELDALESKNRMLEQEMQELKTEIMQLESRLFEQINVKLEKVILDRAEGIIDEAKNNMKKMLFVVAIGCIICLFVANNVV